MIFICIEFFSDQKIISCKEKNFRDWKLELKLELENCSLNMVEIHLNQLLSPTPQSLSYCDTFNYYLYIAYSWNINSNFLPKGFMYARKIFVRLFGECQITWYSARKKRVVPGLVHWWKYCYFIHKTQRGKKKTNKKTCSLADSDTDSPSQYI